MNAEVDLHLGGLHLEGFDQGFADRAGHVFETTLSIALSDPSVIAHLSQSTGRAVGALNLTDVDTSTPERLAEGLARAVLREVLG